MAGGLLDQDPLFLLRLDEFLSVKHRHDEQKEAHEKRAKMGPQPKNA
jgi:hypothetical protein